MGQEITKINALQRPQYTLENMRKNETVLIPSFQKASVSTTVGRIKDISTKRYSIKKQNDTTYQVRRTQ